MRTPRRQSAKNRTSRPRLENVNLSRTLSDRVYRSRLAELQRKLRLIQQAYVGEPQKAVIVIEGWDAAGKGGVIRRIAAAMDPRGLKVWPIGAPSEQERAQHYLARFWGLLPHHGQIAIFDRSWYGRVLVERIEDKARESDWRRAYDEINAFEALLLDDGFRLLKFFIHISPEEQLARLRRRFEDGALRWTLSVDDFDNRAHRGAYAAAVDEMLDKTSTEKAPWRLVSGENQNFARIDLIREVCDQLGERIELGPKAPTAELLRRAERELGLSRADIARLLGRD